MDTPARPASRLNEKQRMAEAILQARSSTSLAAFLAHHRQAGLGFEEIGHELYLATDRAVSLSYQTVKRWLIDFDLLEVAS